jgi:translation initiation factor IF-2
MPQIIKLLMGLGQMKTATQSLSDDEVELIAAELEREVTIKHADDEDASRSLRGRGGDARGAPAGRDDHGPRRPRQDDAARRDPRDAVVETEAGGITQHIGAYQTESTAAGSPSSTRRATRRSPPCAPAARR